MAESLEIVATGLFASKMGVDTHVSSSTRERLAFSIGNVLLGLGITVLLGHTEIHDMNDVGAL